MKKRLPPLGRRSPSPRHILCNGGLSDIDAELEKLAMNPWCAPQWVGETDLANDGFPAGSLDGHCAVLISSANMLGSRHDASGSRSPACQSSKRPARQVPADTTR